MSEEKTLRECPFCGGEAHVVVDRRNTPLYGVECAICPGAALPIRLNEHEAIEAWNRRAAVTEHDFAMAVHDGELWGKCSECTERQGHYLDAETIQRQHEHIAQLEAERDELQCKWFEEAGLHASHVYRRDELIRDMLTYEDHHCADCECNDSGGKREMKSCFTAQRFAKRAMDMGIEVE